MTRADGASAAQALAEARAEAQAFGKERREQIKRRVRESKVIDEIERLESGGGASGHRLLPPPPPRDAEPASH